MSTFAEYLNEINWINEWSKGDNERAFGAPRLDTKKKTNMDKRERKLNEEVLYKYIKCKNILIRNCLNNYKKKL